MIRSMTAFSSHSGVGEGASWTWDVRSVNGRGLDIRLRLPDGIDGLEAAARKAISDQVSRGNVTLGLKLSRDSDVGAVQLDPAHLDRVLDALDAVADRAMQKGITLAQPTAADVLAQKGVLSYGAESEDSPALRKLLLADLSLVITDFLQMRAAEGKALHAVLEDQLARIETLVAEAAIAAEARGDQVRANIRKALDRLTAENPPVEEERLSQDLALIAVKSDITEELDRLTAHVAAGRELLAAGGPVGRKLDFLTQEFNREANTLCSKSQDKELTRIGLELKLVIDQMREQTQNVE